MKNDTQTHAANPADNAPAQHTPGPWSVGSTFEQGKTAIYDSRCLCVALAWTSEEGPIGRSEIRANAELIASAPRLKRELTRAQAHFKLAHEELVKLREVNAELVAALKRLLRAFESDAEQVPSMSVLLCWETNSAAIKQARTAIARIEKGGAS